MDETGRCAHPHGMRQPDATSDRTCPPHIRPHLPPTPQTTPHTENAFGTSVAVDAELERRMLTLRTRRSGDRTEGADFTSGGWEADTVVGVVVAWENCGSGWVHSLRIASRWQGETTTAIQTPPRQRPHPPHPKPHSPGRGLSKVLLAASLAKMSELGHTEVNLLVDTTNLPAILLYDSHGFTPVLEDEEDRAAWLNTGARLERACLIFRAGKQIRGALGRRLGSGGSELAKHLDPDQVRVRLGRGLPKLSTMWRLYWTSRPLDPFVNAPRTHRATRTPAVQALRSSSGGAVAAGRCREPVLGAVRHGGPRACLSGR